MGTLKSLLISLGAVSVALGTCHSAHASPVEYVFYHPAGSTDPVGWFIYDRDTTTLIDYSISFGDNPIATFTPPATQIYSASKDGFTFSDVVTGLVGPDGYGGTQDYTVHLGAWNEYFAPAQVTFANTTIGVDGAGHDLIGGLTSPIWFEGTKGGGIMNLGGSFYELGPVAAVPEPATISLMVSGLGILGFAFRRKHVKKDVTSTFLSKYGVG